MLTNFHTSFHFGSGSEEGTVGTFVKEKSGKSVLGTVLLRRAFVERIGLAICSEIDYILEGFDFLFVCFCCFSRAESGQS